MADLKKKTEAANKQSDKRKLEDKKSGQGTSKIQKGKNQLKGNKQDQGKGKGKDRPNQAASASTSKIEKVKPGDKGNAVKQRTKNANKGKGKDKPNNKTNLGKDQTKAAGRVDHEGKTVAILEGVQDGLNLVTNILTGGLFPGFI